MQTLNIQHSGENEKYIIGTYDIEILTMPRVYKTVEIKQSQYTYTNLPLPGRVMYQTFYEITGQLFLIHENGEREWLHNIDDDSKKGYLDLLPGEYEIVFREKAATSTSKTKVICGM